MQAFTLVRTLVATWPQFFYRPPSLSDGSLSSENNKPDIYYIVLDRYNNNTVLKKQFGYDNSDFTDFLSKNGFYVKPGAHSNYPYTTFSISSTLNANYQTDIVKRFSKTKDQTYSPYSNGVRYSTVADRLKKLGYSYYHLGTWFEATNYAPMADKVFQTTGQLTVLGHTFTLNTFARQELSSSVYNRFFQRGLLIGNHRVLEFVDKASGPSSLSNLAELKEIAEDSPGGRFIFAHFLIPHDPYTFNADGTLNKNYANNNVGKPVKEKYIEQVKFINKEMEAIVSTALKKSDNQAIVIIQADEGAWPTKLNIEKAAAPKSSADEVTVPLPGDMRKWPEADLQMKYGILAAYHIPKVGEKDLRSKVDSVNVFRLVFNTYFNGKFPYLPKCYYGFPEGSNKPFEYTDITKLLVGKANPDCAPDSNFSKK